MPNKINDTPLDSRPEVLFFLIFRISWLTNWKQLYPTYVYPFVLLLTVIYITNELEWRARTVINCKGAWPEETVHVKFLWAGCSQEELGSIMRVKRQEVAMNKSPHIKARSKVLITSGT